jgi:hypothetical protein
VVFRLSPSSSGLWSEAVLYSFKGGGQDGASNNGMVYELVPQPRGAWSERVLHNFAGSRDGAEPLTANLLFDARGNLYGVTFVGGAGLYGIAYELSPTPSGPWTETFLHSFLGLPAQDAGYPSGLVFDAHGNLWGGPSGSTTGGVAFEFTP